jgi:hypothetical protein
MWTRKHISFVVHPQPTHNGLPMDGALVGAWSGNHPGSTQNPLRGRPNVHSAHHSVCSNRSLVLVDSSSLSNSFVLKRRE